MVSTICPTGLDSFAWRGGDPQRVPHLDRVVYEGKSFPCLLTIPGRPPLCLRCRATGHLRGECPGQSAAFTYAGRVAQLTLDLGQVEVEEAGEPVVDRVDGGLVGAPVSGAGPGADIGGDREPESGRVVAQAGVEALVGVEGGGGAPLQSEVTPGGGTVDVASGAVPRPPRGGGKRKGGSRAGEGSDTKVRPRGSGLDSSLSVDDGTADSGFQTAAGGELSGSLSVSPAPGGGVGGTPWRWACWVGLLLPARPFTLCHR